MRKQKENPAEAGVTKKKRPFFTTNNLIASVVSFVVFLVVSLGVYYITAGEFATAKLAWIYVVLALVGALSVLLRFYRFVALYYVGCALGWVTGYYISNLKGEFAPTAGSLATVFFIAVFIMFGCIAQGKGLRKTFLRWREERQQRKGAQEELPEPVVEAPPAEAKAKGKPLPEAEPAEQPGEDAFEFSLAPDPALELKPEEEPEPSEPWDEDKLEEARKARESAELAMGLKLSVVPEPEKKPEEKREAKAAPLPLDLDEDQTDDLLL